MSEEQLWKVEEKAAVSVWLARTSMAGPGLTLQGVHTHHVPSRVNGAVFEGVVRRKYVPARDDPRAEDGSPTVGDVVIMSGPGVVSPHCADIVQDIIFSDCLIGVGRERDSTRAVRFGAEDFQDGAQVQGPTLNLLHRLVERRAYVVR